jgi:hypothetical protein
MTDARAELEYSSFTETSSLTCTSAPASTDARRGDTLASDRGGALSGGGEVIFMHAPHLTDDLDRIARRLAGLYREDGAAGTIHIDCQSWPRVRLHGRSGVDLHRRVIDIDPRSPRPHFLLAEAYALVGDREAAIAELKTAAALSLESGSDGEARVIDLVLKKMLDGPTE